MNAFLAELIMNLKDICITYLRGQIVIQFSDEIHNRGSDIKIFLIAFLKNLPDDFNSDEFMGWYVDDEVEFLHLISNVANLWGNMKVLLMLVNLQKHSLDALKAWFHDGAESSRVCPLAYFGFEKVLNQIECNSLFFRQESLEPLEEVLLVCRDLTICY